MSAGLFLDRDGTLIVDRHHLSIPGGVELLPGVAAALARARRAGWRLYVFSNQSGIGRGLFTLGDAQRVTARMVESLGPGPWFTACCHAPERPEEPARYRKPSPRFILERIAADGLDRRRCWMVGDRPSDIAAGRAAGIRAALVQTGPELPGRDDPRWAGDPPPVFPDLAAFVAAEIDPLGS